MQVTPEKAPNAVHPGLGFIIYYKKERAIESD